MVELLIYPIYKKIKAKKVLNVFYFKFIHAFSFTYRYT